MALVECPECKSTVSTQASACPNCGCPIATRVVATAPQIQPDSMRPAKKVAVWKILLGLFGVFVLVGIFVTISGKSDHTAQIQSSNTSGTTNQGTTLPEDEIQFISTVTSFEGRYGEGANEFQKSEVRRQRAQALAALLVGRSVQNWAAQISSMSTNSDGNGVLSLVLPGSHIKIATWNNALSDIEDNTLIPHASPLYSQVANLAEGDTVFFSGRFASGDLDYVKESSLTEEGAMTEPEFIFTFASVGKQPLAPPGGPSSSGGSGEQGAESTTTSVAPSEMPAPVGAPTQVGDAANQSSSSTAGAQTLNQSGATEAKPGNSPPAVIKGQTAAEVLAILGPPESITIGPQRAYSYPHLKIIFVDGLVTEIQQLSDDGAASSGAAVSK